VVIRAVEVDDE
jgi:hypothetical protein